MHEIMIFMYLGVMYLGENDLWCQGPDTRCNFSCNLQRNSTLGRRKIGKYVQVSITGCKYSEHIKHFLLIYNS